MKRYLIILVALCLSCSVFAQKASVDNSSFGLQVSPFGFYGYNERLLSSTSTLRIELGMELGFEDLTNPEKTQSYLLHHIALEPRYYYNFKKRAANRKNTFGNSADFVTLRTRLRPGYIFSATDDISAIPTLAFIPSWGFRRVINEKLVVELGIGAGYRFFLNDEIYEQYDDEEITHFVVNLHCRFGIHFCSGKDK